MKMLVFKFSTNVNKDRNNVGGNFLMDGENGNMMLNMQ